MSHPTAVYKNALREEAERRAQLVREHRARFVDLAYLLAVVLFFSWLAYDIGRIVGPVAP